MKIQRESNTDRLVRLADRANRSANFFSRDWKNLCDAVGLGDEFDHATDDTIGSVIDKASTKAYISTHGVAENLEEDVNSKEPSSYQKDIDNVIDTYRHFANLPDDAKIAKDNINDFAVIKTATYTNRSRDNVRSFILNHNRSIKK